MAKGDEAQTGMHDILENDQSWLDELSDAFDGIGFDGIDNTCAAETESEKGIVCVSADSHEAVSKENLAESASSELEESKKASDASEQVHGGDASDAKNGIETEHAMDAEERSLDINIDVAVPDDMSGAEGKADASFLQSLEVDKSIEGQPVVAKAFDIDALKERLFSSKSSEESEPCDPLKDDQLWQFVSLILMRLFDDLELLVVQKHCDEADDIMKQFNRLANLLAFAGMDEQLPLIAYIGNMLPLSYSDAEIGTMGSRRFDALLMRRFMDSSGEFLNCLVYLITYLSKKATNFDTGRYTDCLEALYDRLDAKPGMPSIEAPLPVTDAANPRDLTTRTANKLARTLDALVTESLHYIESSVKYGYSNGYNDAVKSISNAAQICKEYNLENLRKVFVVLYGEVRRLSLPERPNREVYDNYLRICTLFENHFSHFLSEKKLNHLKTLIMRFMNEIVEEKTEEIFSLRWKEFMKSSAPAIDFENSTRTGLLDKLHILKDLSRQYSIEWLLNVFSKLESYWNLYKETCEDTFIHLCDELRAFPTEDVTELDLNQLDSTALQTLFKRSADSRPSSLKSVLNRISEASDRLLELVDRPREIEIAEVHDLLIEARAVHCHALIRSLEVMISLLERVPMGKDGMQAGAAADSVVNGLYFTVSLIQAVCERLKKDIEHDSETENVSSYALFYAMMMKLYATPGQPRDGITSYVGRRLASIINELQLVWVNASTPTSTEYYCGLIRQLLYVATMCELADVRTMIISLLDDIPQQDFINTDNTMMQRRCLRCMRAIEDSCPKLGAQTSSSQTRLFFAKVIAAFNQMLSSRDANDSAELSAEIYRIENRMAMHGMMTDFPPVIAMIHEMHHMAFENALTRDDVESFLYDLLNVANAVCPDWRQSRNAELEFVKTSFPMPMSLFQQMYESICIVHDTLQVRASDEPVAWEHIVSLYHSMQHLVGYLPEALQAIVQNAQNRCRYLKKNIYIDLVLDDYPRENDLPTDAVRPAVQVVFLSIADKLLEAIVDYAFTSTDYNSRINIVLQPFPYEFSISIVHNGKLFTLSEMLERLKQVNIVPAPDDFLLDLLAGSRQLTLTYPPVNTIAYILPLLRQFNGNLEISNADDGNSRFYLSFKL